ncbi:PQQ-dependent sugar dehydrogenase [Fictibacillus sp. b24]|uniref:PQQ-dependent sugar dehydrogenase n=1 Tax=Fictibacillus sp. b24 TaxID=3055863 RepID=UPI0025A11C12|nr:PQQ-dependent sugar dehydrogenase [Fictibacillus sp. b24]MDM5315309.1 PQQ-dependent sugar dehydrogenase [Fictibacillus sp. b24]
MKIISLTILTAFSIFSGCSSLNKGEVKPDSHETIVKKLNIPWQINGTQNEMWISERSGGLVSIGPKHKKTSYTPEFSSALSDDGEGGFLGFVLDPNFKTNKIAYAYYTYEKKGRLLNRIVKMNFETGKWIENQILLDDIPGGFTHNGGRLEWGPDKKLYITTGDSGDENLSQNLDSLAGKILRINSDGTIPKDNPFYPSPVYTYGHRNPQGMTWDEEGTMYAAEHGSSNYDEINKISPGKNYGWPVIRGNERREGMEIPWIHSGKETWAPSGIHYKKGFIYIASLRGESVMKVKTSSKKRTLIVTNEGRIRDILVDGNEMYIVTNNTDGRGQPSKDDDRLLKVPLEK